MPMKSLFLFVATCALCLAMACCTGRTVPAEEPSGAEEAAEEARIDSFIYDVEEDVSAPMPAAADELFDDFIFNFASSARLQMSRIAFPLVHRRGTRTDTISSGKWEMNRFFMDRDFYTLILDDEMQAENTEDTAVSRAAVEKIYLESGYITRYDFERKAGKWMMTAVCDTTWHGTAAGDFLAFYARFAVDTLFQEASIQNPLAFTGPDPDDDFAEMEGLIMAEQWASFAPDLPRGTMYCVIHGAPPRSTQKKVFVIRGIANGLETSMVFRKREGKWKLTKLSI